MTDQRQGTGGGGEGSIPCPFRDGGARGWEGWLRAEPGPDPKRLFVVGEVHTEAGYAGRLKLTHMDKMRPPNQYALLTLEESPGAPGGWQPIRAEQETDQDQFTSVMIHCHDELLVTISPVPVVV
jgi:hypothetical protein